MLSRLWLGLGHIDYDVTIDGEPTVNARELHKFLEVGKEFANWIKDHIKKYGFSEGSDYTVIIANSGDNSKRGPKFKEYFITFDMGKELSMASKTPKGKEARKFFIESDKRRRNPLTVTGSDAPTMSSKEISDLLDVRHDSVKRAIERLANNGIFVHPPLVDEQNPDKLGRMRKEQVYLCDKRTSMIVVAQLCPEATAKIVDRWQELEEEKANGGFGTFDFDDPAFQRKYIDHLDAKYPIHFTPRLQGLGTGAPRGHGQAKAYPHSVFKDPSPHQPRNAVGNLVIHPPIPA